MNFKPEHICISLLSETTESPFLGGMGGAYTHLYAAGGRHIFEKRRFILF